MLVIVWEVIQTLFHPPQKNQLFIHNGIIWCIPEIGVPQIIQNFMLFSTLNQPFWDTPGKPPDSPVIPCPSRSSTRPHLVDRPTNRKRINPSGLSGLTL